MSRFFSSKYKNLTPYTPGEQPRDMQYIKLNTNESPYPPSEIAQKRANEEMRRLQLYPDPTCLALTEKMAALYGLSPDEVVPVNGSDEILNFAFMAFCDKDHPALFPDITYGFYPVFAELNGVPYEEIPLKDDFSIGLDEYCAKKGTVFLANPNAPTGIAIPASEIEKLLRSDRNRVVVVDEAYVDFGAESCIPLIAKYDNLLVTQTFSKSRSMAGARIGFGFGQKELIRDMNTIRFSTNPYNINRATMAAAIGVLEDEEYTAYNCRRIADTREYTAEELKKLGFVLTPSRANFLFAMHPSIPGGVLYRALKERGILVRHFEKARIDPYLRITVGDRPQMDALLSALKNILEESK